MFSDNNANAIYPRALRSPIQRDLGLYRVVVVVGARQVGKSTLCREIAEEREMAYRTLDDQDVLRQAKEDPAGLLDDLGSEGAFIDEIQRAPGLFLAVKAIVDRDQRMGQYLLSGSAQPRIRGGVGDSLVGRATYRTLRPLTLSELRLQETHPGWSFLFDNDEKAVVVELERRAAASGELQWHDVVQAGGFPSVLRAPPEDRLAVVDSYISIFASRDVREILDIASPDQFEAFLRLLATRTGQALNINGMGSDLQISPNTLRRWLGALEASFLVERIGPFSRNAGHRVIKAPKIYMVDAALAIVAARDTAPTGFHLENLVATDLRVWQGMEPGRGLFHWRQANGQEVDFVLEERGTLVPVEVKATRSVGTGETRHLQQFRKLHSNALRGVLLSADPVIRVLAPGIIAAPWWAVV